MVIAAGVHYTSTWESVAASQGSCFSADISPKLADNFDAELRVAILILLASPCKGIHAAS